MTVLLHQPTGLVVGLNQHAEHPGERFDERRSDLDHVGFAVERRADLNVLVATRALLSRPQHPAAQRPTPSTSQASTR
jgi:hypothetical protein